VFDAGHRERVRVLEEGLHGSGVSLAGAAFHGSGIDGAVRSAEATASRLDA
jgi:oxygen-dependent protoporphyrinogen oxidase